MSVVIVCGVLLFGGYLLFLTLLCSQCVCKGLLLFANGSCLLPYAVCLSLCVVCLSLLADGRCVLFVGC